MRKKLKCKKKLPLFENMWIKIFLKSSTILRFNQILQEKRYEGEILKRIKKFKKKENENFDWEKEEERKVNGFGFVWQYKFLNHSILL